MSRPLTTKKIALVSDAVYPFNKGGKEKRLHDLSTRLAHSHEVTIYCMKWWEGEEVIVKDNVTLHAISPYYPLYQGERRSFKEAIFFALHCLKLVTKDFDVIEVDHIPHLALFTTKIVCLLKRKKLITTWHEVWGKKYWQEYLGSLGLIAYLVERISVTLPTTIISVSPHTTLRLQNLLKRRDGVVTITNGVDLNLINSILPANTTTDIIFVGRLLSHKNVDLLLRAASILKESKPSISVSIIGNGPEAKNLFSLAQELNLQNNVIFLTDIDTPEKLYGLMKSARVFVLPSTREGFGIAALEANACGLPIITINHPDNATTHLIKEGENGALASFTKADLAKVINKYLNTRKDPAYYQTYAKNYDWPQLVSKVINVYNQYHG